MKNLIIIIAVLFSINTQAQKVTWVPSSETDEGCTMVTDCRTNTLCYSLAYTPESSGILTSYTTGFFTSCIDGSANVVHNQSCVITDNSKVISACEQFDKTLLNCSGNTGQLAIVKDETIILHQVCFDIDVDEEIVLEEDPVMGITVSIDLAKDIFSTSKPKFDAYLASTRNVDSPCDHDLHQVDDTPTFGFMVYPNPSAGSVNVVFNDGGKTAAMSILTADNKRMMTQTIECKKEYNFDLNHYQPGTYIVRVKGENDTESKKFIILK